MSGEQEWQTIARNEKAGVYESELYAKHPRPTDAQWAQFENEKSERAKIIEAGRAAMKAKTAGRHKTRKGKKSRKVRKTRKH